jgi:diguanylate cyclase (GGDEF)-like protein
MLVLEKEYGEAILRMNNPPASGPPAIRPPGAWGTARAGGARFVRKYLAAIFLTIILVILSVFWGFNYKSTSLIHEQLRRQGQAFFQEVVLTREWIANHGGVYVKLAKGMEVNSYLSQVPGLKVVIEDKDGEKYTLKNPALATREISLLANTKGIFKFKITSLNPLNPGNGPDAFEKAALESFEAGAMEHSRYENADNEVFFRYMAPLVTEKPCLRCHASQGYREGDIRGGISVTIAATAMVRKMDENRTYLAASALGIITLFFAIISLVYRSFIKDLKYAEDMLVEMASRDSLTGLLNRREALQRIGEEHSRAGRLYKPLSVILIDIDNFKKINDTYGHAAGDEVLMQISRSIQGGVREYDVVCRYGGEEFLVATVESSLEVAKTVAERLRRAAEDMVLGAGDGRSFRVTISAGVAQCRENESIEQLISRADASLYIAKADGRNRVCLA